MLKAQDNGQVYNNMPSTSRGKEVRRYVVEKRRLRDDDPSSTFRDDYSRGALLQNLDFYQQASNVAQTFGGESKQCGFTALEYKLHDFINSE